MKRSIHIFYGIGIAVLLIFYLYSLISCRVDLYAQRGGEGYTYIDNYKSERLEANSDVGVKNVYKFIIDEAGDGTVIAFYTINQKVSVSIDGHEIYNLKPDKDNPFGKTTGGFWVIVPLRVSDNGKEAAVTITPVYESSIDIVPEFYFGSEISIYKNIICSEIPSLSLSVVAVIIGIIFLILDIHIYKVRGRFNNLFMLGLFAINISLWKITDLNFLRLFVKNSIATSYIPILCLMLVIIPFMLYIKEFFTESENIVWYVPCYTAVLFSGISIFCQVFDIKDIRETLWLTHLAMIVMVGAVCIMVIRELVKYGWNKKLIIVLFGIVSSFVGLIIDMVVYYVTSGVTRTAIGMLAFLVYIIVMGINSIKGAVSLIEIGAKAKHFEDIAYHDQMTGMYNRTAYANDIGASDFTPEKVVLFMFDLNNLKKCNDTFGHENGDLYIINSAKIIQKIFGDIGKCYRMGGDEFCVLLKGINTDKCKKYLEALQKEVEEYNKSNPQGYVMQIACGYERYDKQLDYDLGDTLRRADRKMYNQKFHMKQEAETANGI